ncbi:TPA: hypothetical protein QHB96_004457 [Citrobacter freundii]|uniref:hypothetical protein n=1 Tax=Citrobacter sp. wls757 TaxID=2576417 RepID=UPI0010CA17B1|nr:hypothetical protein [Citrobacter sp. wls757]EHO5973680.1 hypothetical protein [Salmonella enterica]HAP0441401.1 hypothetical protein [Escherichia coli]HDT5995682.1 hypothetical protein [Citrobacter freundii]TKU43470.1 hypothetical protein FDW94_13820 [Citrobacter sp. wls757]HDC2134104.1 hypothetical protein [Salmonella enterica]
MPKTLIEVFDYLTTERGHQYLWLNLTPRTSYLGSFRLPIDFLVVSSSGQELAEFDGTGWYYINPGFLTFDVAVHGVPPSTVGTIPLDKNSVIDLKKTFVI